MAESVGSSSPPSSSQSESPPSGSESESSNSIWNLREELDECLSNVQSDGSFALFEHLSNPPNPGICLKNGELIGLPLSNRDAQVIVDASHAAPFGKGEETLVDSRVRKTWELSASDFQIRNPAWEPFLKLIVAKVSAGLGVDATGRGVSAELYKMLLYDEGAMFKPHQDSEKAPRMFATLVIALPSKHEGGEVRVTHDGKTKTFETSKFSEFDSSYLAWFADVTHEVKPVLAGHRLVLTYNLIHTTLSSYELTATADMSMLQLRSSLINWKHHLGTGKLPTKLAFLLEHKYTNASLCYNGLKGHDRQVAAHLRDACQELGFYFYLASFQREVYGGCDEDGGYGDWDDDGDDDGGNFHVITEDISISASLSKVVDLEGMEVDKDLEFDEKYFIQKDSFENKAPDSEDYSGYTGNEGVSATHFYHRTIALIIPRSHHMEFFLSSAKERRTSRYSLQFQDKEKEKVIQWIDRLTAELAKNPTDNAPQEALRQICQTVIRKTQKFKLAPQPKYSWQTPIAPFSDEAIARVVSLCVELDDQKLFVDAYELYSKRVALQTFEFIGKALLRYDLQSLLPKLSAFISTLNTFSERLEIFVRIRTGLNDERERNPFPDTPYQDWLTAEFNNAISPLVAMNSGRDGTCLISVSRRLPSEGLFNKILPAIKRNIEKTPMVIAFLAGLSDSERRGEIPEDVANTLFRDITADLADSSFSLDTLALELVERKQKSAPPNHFMGLVLTPSEPVVDQESSRNIAAFLCACQELELTAELDQIVKKLLTEMKRAQLELFHCVYIPLLKLLVKRFSEKATINSSPFQPLFRQILYHFIFRYVQPEPTPPKDWKQATVGCRCADCQSLNRFLASPTEKVGRFSVAKKRRQHLHQVLDQANSGCTHETERRGSPQTLVVTKTRARYQAAHNAWAARRSIAKKHLEELGAEALKGLLGEMYTPIMSLSTSQLQLMISDKENSAQTAALAANANASNRVLEPPTRRKVPSSSVQPKVIVIDDSD